MKMPFNGFKREIKKCLICTLFIVMALHFSYVYINLRKNSTKELFEDHLRINLNLNKEPVQYITINERGRLGNRMFIYASLLGIAAKNKMKPILDRYSDVFNIFQAPTLKDAVNKSLYRQLSFEAHGNIASRIYTPSMENLPNKHVFLKGYFQSYLYFKDIYKDIKTEFAFNPRLSYSSYLFLCNQLKRFNLSTHSTVFIGIHVRRGDVTSDIRQEKGFSVPGRQYFMHAMACMRNKIVRNKIFWIVASNDHKWCHGNIEKLPGEYIAYSNGDAALDLAVLSKCNHTVMSVGSFSWWAAWLAGGEAIYYKKWPTPNSKFDRKTNLTTYYPSSWISVE